MVEPQKKVGFPLLMLVGFSIAAAIATVSAFILSSGTGRFSYTGLFDLVASLGALGAYIGHCTGAARNKEAGHKPFGPLSQIVLTMGAVIVAVGTIVVVGAVAAIMTWIKGPPPH